MAPIHGHGLIPFMTMTLFHSWLWLYSIHGHDPIPFIVMAYSIHSHSPIVVVSL